MPACRGHAAWPVPMMRPALAGAIRQCRDGAVAAAVRNAAAADRAPHGGDAMHRHAGGAAGPGRPGAAWACAKPRRGGQTPCSGVGSRVFSNLSAAPIAVNVAPHAPTHLAAASLPGKTQAPDRPHQQETRMSPNQNRSGRLARDAMAFVLAGGRGSRLMELTDRRAKPGVYFGGKTRIIDFALSNALNSGIRRIGVATQYKAHSLIRHLTRGWSFMRAERNESFDILPASQRVSESAWYSGTADAVFQNIDIIESYAPKYMVVLAGDHIYKMDYEVMLQQHVDCGRRRHAGLPGSAAHGGHRLRRHACRRQRHHPELHRETRRPARHPRQPRDGAGLDGHLRLQHRVPVRPAAPRRCRRRTPATTSARTWCPGSSSNGKAVAHRFSASPACARSRRPRPTGAMSARSTPTGNPTSTSPTITPALDLYDTELADLDLQRTDRPGQVRARRRRAAAATPSARWCRAAASSRAPSCGARCCSPACAPIRTRSIDEAVILPYVTIGRHVRLKQVVIDRGVRHPRRPGGGRRS